MRREEVERISFYRPFSNVPHCKHCGRLLRGGRKEFCSDAHAQAHAAPRSQRVNPDQVQQGDQE